MDTVVFTNFGMVASAITTTGFALILSVLGLAMMHQLRSGTTRRSFFCSSPGEHRSGRRSAPQSRFSVL